MLAVAGARSRRLWSAFHRHSQSKHSIVRPADPLDTTDLPVTWLDASAAEWAESAGPSSDVHSASLRSHHSGETISLDEKESGSDDWMPANASSLTTSDKISSEQALMRGRSSVDDTNLGLSMRQLDILRQQQEKVQSYSRAIASLCHTPKRVLLNARYLTALIARLDVLQQQRLDQMNEVGVEETVRCKSLLTSFQHAEDLVARKLLDPLHEIQRVKWIAAEIEHCENRLDDIKHIRDTLRQLRLSIDIPLE